MIVYTSKVLNDASVTKPPVASVPDPTELHVENEVDHTFLQKAGWGPGS
jgi:hypothetical protein